MMAYQIKKNNRESHRSSIQLMFRSYNEVMISLYFDIHYYLIINI